MREGAVPPLITLCTRNDMLVLKHVSGALAKLALDPHAREQVRDSNYTIIHRNPHAREEVRDSNYTIIHRNPHAREEVRDTLATL